MKSKILVLEDEVLLALSIKKYLEKAGYTEVILAQDYEEAIELINTHELLLAILDIHIGGTKTGLDLATYLNENNSAIPLIFVTSYSDKSTMEEIREVKPAAYLNKPIKEMDLVMAVDLAISTNQKEETHQIELQVRSEKYVFNIDEIIYAKADHVYTIFVTISEKYLFRLSLKKILEQLPEDIFAQVNRSVVINKSFIQKVTSNSVTVNEKVFKISPIFKENFI